ncbi:hypothetical protein E2C01_015225 [Portunus trituberculatus]|uniref:Uncharacterized protein n=1 Tax=Portunus trituberculatus TaxID=210409 RepID=A0A5B7DMD1_PORTR|nr:hypothetical protein [Portunus trituberculatus]
MRIRVSEDRDKPLKGLILDLPLRRQANIGRHRTFAKCVYFDIVRYRLTSLAKHTLSQAKKI